MTFSEHYLGLCQGNRALWSKKKTMVGDWYMSLDPPRLGVVSEIDVDSIDFSRDDLLYIPDTDDLLELLDNQIAALDGSPVHKTLQIRYDMEERWSMEIETSKQRSVVRGQECIHSLLLRAVFQMSVRRD